MKLFSKMKLAALACASIGLFATPALADPVHNHPVHAPWLHEAPTSVTINGSVSADGVLSVNWTEPLDIGQVEVYRESGVSRIAIPANSKGFKVRLGKDFVGFTPLALVPGGNGQVKYLHIECGGNVDPQGRQRTSEPTLTGVVKKDCTFIDDSGHAAGKYVIALN